MLTTYRRVLALPGALVFSLSGLVARLPISMVSLGIVLLVSTRTGSYSLAGTVSASYLIANALFAVLQARFIDRLGQSRVLPVAVTVFAVGMVAMMWAVETDVRAPWPHLCAALSGAAMPQIGSCVRARWSLLVPDKQALHTAFAFEAVMDETVFILGPGPGHRARHDRAPARGPGHGGGGRGRRHGGAGRAATDGAAGDRGRPGTTGPARCRGWCSPR